MSDPSKCKDTGAVMTLMTLCHGFPDGKPLLVVGLIKFLTLEQVALDGHVIAP